MKELHFKKHGRGQLYVADEGNYRFVVHQTRKMRMSASPSWNAWVCMRASWRCLDPVRYFASKTEAIAWLARSPYRKQQAETFELTEGE